MCTGYFNKLREDICCNGNDISVDASHELTKFNDNFGQERVFVEVSAQTAWGSSDDDDFGGNSAERTDHGSFAAAATSGYDHKLFEDDSNE